MTKEERASCEVLKRLVSTIRNETKPIKGHPDANAIQDCFNEINDIIDCMYSKNEVLKIVGKCIERSYVFAKSGKSGIPILEVKFDDLLKPEL